MAKKKIEESIGSKFSINDLAKKLSILNLVEEINIADTNERVKIKDWISTGNLLLNAQISSSLEKGIPSGRTVLLAGESGCLHPTQKIKVYISQFDEEKEIETIQDHK
jgi:hypothetical protein